VIVKLNDADCFVFVLEESDKLSFQRTSRQESFPKSNGITERKNVSNNINAKNFFHELS
jgi:hypothetical protein